MTKGNSLIMILQLSKYFQKCMNALRMSKRHKNIHLRLNPIKSSQLDKSNRIYKNKETIGWSGKVHERIVGFDSYTAFPLDEVYCIKHPKTIQRQERQNDYYDTLM
jgi:hypothetical protein